MSEIAWAAGLFEGEGSIIVPKDGNAAWLSMGSTDKDVLERFARAVGRGGRINGPYRPNGSKTPPGRKPIYHWRFGGIEQIQSVLRDFWPYLGERRRARAAEAIAEYYLSGKHRIPQRRNRRAYSVQEI